MLKKYSIDLARENKLQYFIGFLCLFVYAGSLFFPLMDKDAGHHANIALYMYEHNDWISLVDREKDYLDKPHFLFWSSLLSFKIFGVNTFAHRLPALLFALISVYSTYKLTRHLSDKTTAKMAAILLATAQAFVLSINDARMETPLTAGIMLGLWQLILYIDTRKFSYLFFASLGAAMAFATKGWIGPVVMFVPVFFYILLNKKWNVLSSLKTWTFVPLFFLFISPVLYAYYIQFDLHPEKVIREKNGRSGIHFILWDQLFERSSGFDQGKKGRNSDYFFLYHTFIWAFFPWSIIAYVAIVYWFKRMFVFRKWRHGFNFAALAFAFLLFSISFSNFKMPHYIIMLLPLAALFTAPYLRFVLSYSRPLKWMYPLHVFFVSLVILLTILLNYYFFPPGNFPVWIAGSLLLVWLVIFLLKKYQNKAYKLLFMSAAASLVFNFFMNYNFFPSLLKYQGGNQLVALMKEKKINIRDEDIFLLETNAHSFDFYRNRNHRIVSEQTAVEQYGTWKDKYFLMSNHQADFIRSKGLQVQPIASHMDHNVTTITLKFLNPEKRNQNLDTLMLAKIYKP